MDVYRSLPQTDGASLVILENDQIRTYNLDSRSDRSIGRFDPNQADTPDILLKSRIVSRTHGWFKKIDDDWYFIDNPKNLNGTFHNGTKIPRPLNGMKRPTPLEDGDILRIDNSSLNCSGSQGVVILFKTESTSQEWAVFPLPCETTIIGRDISCTIVVADPQVSPRHAKISYLNGAFYLSNCSSGASTFLNGHPIISATPLKENDLISVSDHSFFFLGNKLLYSSDKK